MMTKYILDCNEGLPPPLYLLIISPKKGYINAKP
jgi:hypothetical protein